MALEVEGRETLAISRRIFGYKIEFILFVPILLPNGRSETKTSTQALLIGILVESKVTVFRGEYLLESGLCNKASEFLLQCLMATE